MGTCRVQGCTQPAIKQCKGCERWFCKEHSKSPGFKQGYCIACRWH